MNIEAKIIIFLSPKAFYFIFFYPYKKNWSTAGTNSKLQEKKCGPRRAPYPIFSYFCSGFQSSKPPLVPAADNEVKLLSENFFMLQKYNYTLIRTQNKVHRFHDWGVCVQI